MKTNRLFGVVARILTILVMTMGMTMAGLSVPVLADEFDSAFNAYSAGDFGVARTLLKPLAQGGDIRAQYLLGRIYSEGEGVAKNDAEGVKWYRLAADRGDIVSQLVLGTMYVNGRGVRRSYVRAYSWFTIVSQNGDRDMTGQALEVRDLIEQLMTTQEIKKAEAFAAAWKPQ